MLALTSIATAHTPWHALPTACVHSSHGGECTVCGIQVDCGLCPGGFGPRRAAQELRAHTVPRGPPHYHSPRGLTQCTPSPLPLIAQGPHSARTPHCVSALFSRSCVHCVWCRQELAARAGDRRHPGGAADDLAVARRVVLGRLRHHRRGRGRREPQPVPQPGVLFQGSHRARTPQR